MGSTRWSDDHYREREHVRRATGKTAFEYGLGKLFLEGGGGGQLTESYELAMYFMAQHTSMDCFEKRNQRGYLFIIGDEMPYRVVKRAEVERVIGEGLQADLPIEDLLAQ